MLFIPDLVIAAISLYVAYAVLKAWRSLADWRLSLYSLGMLLLATSLLVEAVADMYLRLEVGEAPLRFIRRQEVLLRVLITILQFAALTPIAIAVTPSMLYAVLPLLVPVNVALSLYIAAVMLVKNLERKAPPWTPLAFFFFALSMLTPLLAFQDLVFRSLTALFLALGVYYGKEKKK
ncbi:MAG: hypothetical protein ABWK05_08870 [Pyrobaculum sp.]